MFERAFIYQTFEIIIQPVCIICKVLDAVVEHKIEIIFKLNANIAMF